MRHRRRGRGTGSRTALLAAAALWAAASTAAIGAEPETRRVVPNPEHAASGWHQYWFGKGYRDLWTTAVDLPVLDLKTEAGGLTLVRRVGGLQTPGLALKGADGRAYTFRKLVKNPDRILPPEWRNTVPAGLFRDQMAAGHPAAAPMCSYLSRSVGILYAESRLMVMPDDPALGEHRAEFANQAGTFDTYPLAGDEGILEIVSSKDLWAKWLQSPANRVDSRQFLKARLLDLATGNWDRHRKQWRWARVEGQPLWQPVPEDPDQCFTLYGGVAIAAVRKLQPKFMEYSGRYPGRIEGLTYNNGDVDRWLLSDVEWPVYEEVARELQARLTDDVIEQAMRQAPPAWQGRRGAELASALRQRRDGLRAYARRFYEHLARTVDVRASDADEVARVAPLEGGGVEAALSVRRPDGSEGPPYFRRAFSPNETEEVRLYLHGGNDRLVKTGGTGGITVRVLGGPGDDVLDDARSGGADMWDSEGRNVLLAGPGTRVHEAPWTNPVPLEDGPWIEPRNYGRWTMPLIELWWEPDQDFMLGGGLARTSWGFRKTPWASRQSLSLLYSTGYADFRAAYSGEWRLAPGKRLAGRVDLKVSGIEDENYFGLGNETEPIEEKDLYKTRTSVLSAFPSLRLEPSREALFYMGAEIKAVNTDDEHQSLVDQEQPYGAGAFAEVALRAGFELDSRGRTLPIAGLTPAELAEAANTRVEGARLTAQAFYAPQALDAEEDFGGVEGEVAGYLGNRKVSLAARAGGRALFGRYPWFESAHLGGSDNVRAYHSNRFRGDTSLYGSVELRVWIGNRSRPLLPLRFGLFGFSDVGRVWYAGEDSGTWHPSYGGGLMARLAGTPLMVSLSAAGGGGEGTRIYFLMGQSF